MCALPLPLLAEVDTDFTPEFKALVSSVPYAAAGKIGLQFKRRFWEEDHQIFGGATKTDMDITQIVYPSTGYLGKKGTLVGYYLQGQSGRPIGETTPAQRQALALEQGSKIHPQYAAEFEHAFSVAWHKVKWNKGSWSATPAATKAKLREPQGRDLPGRRPPRSECLDAGRLRVGASRGHCHPRPGRRRHAPAGALNGAAAPSA